MKLPFKKLGGGSSLGSGLSVGGILADKKKKYALIGIGAAIMLLLLFILFSGDKKETLDIDGQQFENNTTEQNNTIMSPPPPPPQFSEEALEALESGENFEQNVSAYYVADDNATERVFSQGKNPLFELDDEAFVETEKEMEAEAKAKETEMPKIIDVEPVAEPKIEPQPEVLVPQPLPQPPMPQQVEKPVVKEIPQPQNVAPVQKPLDEAPIAPVENNLSMSQRGISTQKIIETIDKIDSMPSQQCGACCCCNACGDGNINSSANGYGNNSNANYKQGYGQGRVEIRPDDMIIYLKAKQPLMRFDGNNLSFENKTYRERDIFKGWWKVEHINPVYARFYDDLSGYAYNLRFLEGAK